MLLKHSLKIILKYLLFNIKLLIAYIFFLNVITPIIVGSIATWLGVRNTLLGIAVIAAIGHTVIGFAVQFNNYPALLVGRLFAGICYEAIDFMTIPLRCALFWRSLCIL